jgi:predicted nucleic acid-binding protein
VIFLDHLGYMERLHEIADVLLSPDVVRELQAAPGAPGSAVPDFPWIEVRLPARAQRDEVARELAAHAGEAETVALALSGGVVPVIDERRASRYAAARGVPVIGTLALVVELHRRGIADRPIEDDLALLASGGMYLTQDLIAAAIEQVQGSGPAESQGMELPTA